MNSSEINLHKPKKKAFNANSNQNGVWTSHKQFTFRQHTMIWTWE